MKKWLKITLGIIVGILFIFTIDMIFIFTLHRPLFAIKNENGVYKGIFYDTYNCIEYSIPQIKTKGTKFSCSTINTEDTLLTTNNNFRVERYKSYDTIKYYPYYENNERTIFFAGDIKEFCILNEKENSLKEYITTTYQTFEDSIKSITKKMEKVDTLNDGGTTIYKSKELDLTITVCNTLDTNKNVYFDNYKSKFDETMCK